MNTILIFVWIYAAMIAMSFWESYVEGRNAWNKHKLGWSIKLTKKYCLPAYHVYVFWVMWPLLITLPLVIYGWDTRLFGILLSAYTSGMVLEDFMWFVVNPSVKLSEFNPKFAGYYPWIKIGKFHIPAFYVVGIAISLLSWYFIWG
jgi:hypothetical protein